MTRLLTAVAGVLLALPLTAQKNTVSVFILAGQSNMEGKAQNKLFEHQAVDAATKDKFAAFREGDEWREYDDVFIKFLNRHGKLTMGYGSNGRTGCELAFGHYVGEHIDGPVLLIKTAWGGRSIYKNFRPPSAGLPPDEVLAKELAQRTKQVEKRNADPKRKKKDPVPTLEQITAEYGHDYRAMMHDVRETVRNCGKLFPALRGKKTEIAGFVWFQGWNDQYNGYELEYEKNLGHLIRDVRNDLGVGELPFVIGAMGQNGSKPAKGAMKVIQDAQMAMADNKEFKNVRSVRTDVLVDLAAEKLYPEWKKRFEEWERTGSDHPYHYLGSALWFNSIGFAFGGAMMGMIED